MDASNYNIFTKNPRFPVQTGIDPTLSKSGYAADALVVGDIIKETKKVSANEKINFFLDVNTTDIGIDITTSKENIITPDVNDKSIIKVNDMVWVIRTSSLYKVADVYSDTVRLYKLEDIPIVASTQESTETSEEIQ